MGGANSFYLDRDGLLRVIHNRVFPLKSTSKEMSAVAGGISMQTWINGQTWNGNEWEMNFQSLKIKIIWKKNRFTCLSSMFRENIHKKTKQNQRTQFIKKRPGWESQERGWPVTFFCLCKVSPKCLFYLRFFICWFVLEILTSILSTLFSRESMESSWLSISDWRPRPRFFSLPKPSHISSG